MHDHIGRGGRNGATRVAVVGGGIGGLGAALALARQGIHVTMLERDELHAAATAEEAFASARPGAPQALHTHAFLARTFATLSERAPDVLERFLASGATTLPAARNLGDPQPGDEDLFILVLRRTTYEWMLRQAVLAEPNTEIRTAAAVIGIEVERRSGRPHVTGLRLADGTTIGADAVVAATGRRGPVPEWLAEHGLEVPETVRESDLMYLTRWYRRLPTDAPLPESRGMDAGFVKYLAVPGDNDTLSITLAIRPGDSELRRHLSVPEQFDAACRLLPGPDRFFERLDLVAEAPVRPMTGLLNRLRRFTRDDGTPTMAGFFAVGDAHTCTNPIYGRGCSLALVQAFLLADAFAAHPDDAVERGRHYEEASAREVEPWFHNAVEWDQLNPLPSDLDERPGDRRPSPVAALFVAAETNPVLSRGLARLMNLLVTPAELAADQAFTAASIGVLANPDQYPVPRYGGPTRRELLDALSETASTGAA